MSITFQGNQDPYGLSSLGQLMGTYLGQNQAQSRIKNDFSVLEKALYQEPSRGEAGFGPMDAPDSAIQRILMAAQAQGVDPRSLQQFLGQSPGQAYLKEQEISNNQQKYEQDAAYKQQALAQQAMIAANKSPPKSEYEKLLERGSAEQAIKIMNYANSFEKTNKDIQSLKELSPKINFLTSGNKFTKSTDAAEFDSKALLIMEPYIELLTNGRGVVSKEKVKLIENKALPNSTDPQAVRDGKIRAAEDLNNQMKPVIDKFRKLSEEWPKGIPPELIRNLQLEADSVIDAFTQEDKREESKKTSPASSKPKSLNDIEAARKNLASDQVMVKDKKGNVFSLPSSDLEAAMKEGFTKV